MALSQPSSLRCGPGLGEVCSFHPPGSASTQQPQWQQAHDLSGEVLTGRAFFIDSESPLPLQLLLQPRGIDWRAKASS